MTPFMFLDQRHLARATLVLALASSFALPATAANHIVDIAWDTSGAFAHAARVQPDKFVEVCGKLEAGDRVRWSFDAAGPVDFNIHYHVGKKAVFPTKLSQAAKANDELRVAVTQDYCWMWTNKAQRDVGLNVQLRR